MVEARHKDMATHLRNLLINKIHDDVLKRLAPLYLSGVVVDIGCGTKPYRDMIAQYVKRHVGVDHVLTQHDKSNIDLMGTAYEIPAGSNSFDSAICTAVLEHLEEPDAAIKECYRVLKQGGHAIYSVPFIWHLHEEPRDFFRYSKYGLTYLFEKNGFEIIDLVPLSGFWVTFSQLFVYYLQKYNKSIVKSLRIIDALGIVIQVIAYFVNMIDKSYQWTWMYIIVVKKK